MPSLIQHSPQPTVKSSGKLSFGMAATKAEIEQAQRVRYQVFAEEMGANLVSANEGLDRDHFDDFCEHLLVRDEHHDRVVGTYRILPPEQAKRAGSYYSETEFDLSNLAGLRDSLVELGRSCVHQDYRDGTTITQLWNGLADYIGKHDYQYLIGCASISMADGGHFAASVYNKIHKLHAAPAEYSVTPLNRLPLENLNQNLEVIIPPLLKGYLRLGAYICGEPAWDVDFNCADVFIMMPVERLSARYAKHFLKQSAQSQILAVANQ